MTSFSALLTTLVSLSSPALAGTFYVNSTLDQRDATPLGDGMVDADPGTAGDQITLRGAIEEANHLAGSDTIILPAGVFNLTRNGANENQCAKGDLDVRDDLQISGEGADLTFVDGHLINDRVFHIQGADCTLSLLTVRRGTTPSGSQNGGGIFASNSTLGLVESTIANNHSRGDGGGVALQGSEMVTLWAVFSGNRADDDGGAVDFRGLAHATVIELSTFSQNEADGDGGAMNLYQGGHVVFNSTFSKNEAHRGGAIAITNQGLISLLNATLGRNQASSGSGIFENTADSGFDTIVLQNSIISNTAGNNYSGDGLMSLGHNLENGSTCGFTGPGDKKNTNPKLGLLKKNGGTTPTLSLLSGSPAIDASNDQTSGPFDQRGLGRVNLKPNATVSDIGAFERQ